MFAKYEPWIVKHLVYLQIIGQMKGKECGCYGGKKFLHDN